MANAHDGITTTGGSQTIDVNLTWADLRRFMSYHTLHKPTTRAVMFAVYVGWIGYWVHFAYSADFGLRSDDPRAGVLQAAVAVFGGIMAALTGLLWYHLMIGRMTSRALRDSVGGAGAGTVTINSDGVIRSWPTGETRVDWSAVRRIADTSKDVYFFLRRIQAFAIPRRCFPSAAAADAFVQAAREWQARSRH